MTINNFERLTSECERSSIDRLINRGGTILERSIMIGILAGSVKPIDPAEALAFGEDSTYKTIPEIELNNLLIKQLLKRGAISKKTVQSYAQQTYNARFKAIANPGDDLVYKLSNGFVEHMLGEQEAECQFISSYCQAALRPEAAVLLNGTHHVNSLKEVNRLTEDFIENFDSGIKPTKVKHVIGRTVELVRTFLVGNRELTCDLVALKVITECLKPEGKDLEDLIKIIMVG